jgi:hypothetical protein
MEVSILSKDLALGPGAELWVVPEQKFSQWNRQIDWQLNYQITKSQLHSPKSLSPMVQNILDQCALENLDWLETKNERLLILASQNLPNRWVLVLTGANEFDQWLTESVAVWKSLSLPAIRFFLPQSQTLAGFEKKWAKASQGVTSTAPVTVVEDSHG